MAHLFPASRRTGSLNRELRSLYSALRHIVRVIERSAHMTHVGLSKLLPYELIMSVHSFNCRLTKDETMFNGEVILKGISGWVS